MGFGEAVQKCLPVHKMFLRVIQPKLIFMFGKLSHFEGAIEVLEKETLDARHAGWEAHRGRGRLGDLTFAFGNVPHLSVWGGRSREDILRWTLEPIL